MQRASSIVRGKDVWNDRAKVELKGMLNARRENTFGVG